MKLDFILFGGSTIVNISDIAEIEEKQITFSIKKEKPNPEPKPSGFFAKLAYSSTITYYEEETYTCIILKVKGGTQMRGKVDDNGNVSCYSNQLYDFYTIYNDEKFATRIKEDIQSGSSVKVREAGNYYVYPGVLCYSDYVNTNMRFDKTISSGLRKILCKSSSNQMVCLQADGV